MSTSLFTSTSSVKNLTPADFVNGKIITKGKKGMVMFYCNWCHFCKQAKKPYEDTAKLHGSAFPMYGFDCVKYSDYAKQLGIQSYPTIKYINKTGKLGKMCEAERSLQGFSEDICKNARVC